MLHSIAVEQQVSGADRRTRVLHIKILKILVTILNTYYSKAKLNPFKKILFVVVVEVDVPTTLPNSNS